MIEFVRKNLGDSYLRGLVDFLYNRKGYAPGFGILNDQELRQKIFIEIFNKTQFQTIIETGTFRATTTLFFREKTKTNVYSAENHPRFFTYSKLHTLFKKGVHVYFQDSRKLLKKLAKKEKFTKKRTLFYLDAHWEQEHPLRLELKIILENFQDYIIIIDDFKVPDDSGYFYDSYGGVELSINHISDIIKDLKVYFPIDSKFETNRKRGCIVLTNKTDLTFSKLLRSYP